MSESHEIEAVTDPATAQPPRTSCEAADPRQIKLTRVEARVEEVAQEAAAARHLAAFHDRDLADLGVKVDANRKAINALGIQTGARFDRLEKKLDDELADVRAEMRTGFARADQNFLTVRGLLDATAAAQQRTAELLTTLIEQRGDR